MKSTLHISVILFDEGYAPGLRYYATFKVSTFESFFYKVNTCLQKNTALIVLRAEKKISVNI